MTDWRGVTLKPGDWACPTHGIIRPAEGLIPHCPQFVGDRPCQWPATRAVYRQGKLVHEEPAPKVCGCPEQHPLGPNVVLVSWWGCRCTPVGGHRTWTSTVCDDVQEWPPHDLLALQ